MLTSNENSVLAVFFHDPEGRYYIRELARMTGLSAPGILKIVDRLRRQSLLRTEKKLAVTNVCAGEERFFQAKRLYNIDSLYDCGLVDFLRKDDPEAIVVFGSYSNGFDKKDDTIEIAVITEETHKFKLEKFEAKLKRKISVKQINSPSSMGELEKLANGVVLYGSLSL